MTSGMAKRAITAFRNRKGANTRTVARDYLVTVPELHEAAQCQEGQKCTGRGCRLH